MRMVLGLVLSVLLTLVFLLLLFFLLKPFSPRIEPSRAMAEAVNEICRGKESLDVSLSKAEGEMYWNYVLQNGSVVVFLLRPDEGLIRKEFKDAEKLEGYDGLWRWGDELIVVGNLPDSPFLTRGEGRLITLLHPLSRLSLSYVCGGLCRKVGSSILVSKLGCDLPVMMKVKEARSSLGSRVQYLPFAVDLPCRKVKLEKGLCECRKYLVPIMMPGWKTAGFQPICLPDKDVKTECIIAKPACKDLYPEAYKLEWEEKDGMIIARVER